jgi:cardiolipin synthase
VNIPNFISLGRLLTVPITVWLILVGEMKGAFVLFVAAGVSDAVDGFLATRFNMKTMLGRYLDPLADKVLLVGVYITLGSQEYLPVWLVILVASRDFLIVGGTMFSFIVGYDVKVQPLMISKANTATQIALAAVVLGELALEGAANGISRWLIYVVAATTVASGASYLKQWVLNPSGQEPAK